MGCGSRRCPHLYVCGVPHHRNVRTSGPCTTGPEAPRASISVPMTALLAQTAGRSARGAPRGPIGAVGSGPAPLTAVGRRKPPRQGRYVPTRRRRRPHGSGRIGPRARTEGAHWGSRWVWCGVGGLWARCRAAGPRSARLVAHKGPTSGRTGPFGGRGGATERAFLVPVETRHPRATGSFCGATSGLRCHTRPDLRSRPTWPLKPVLGLDDPHDKVCL